MFSFGKKKDKKEAPSSTPDILVKSPVDGKVLRLSVDEAASVQKMDNLCIMEAMSMELEIKAPAPGYVHFTVKPGAKLKRDAPLASISAAQPEPTAAPLSEAAGTAKPAAPKPSGTGSTMED
jgi:biotin carboxyl carrier protein